MTVLKAYICLILLFFTPCNADFTSNAVSAPVTTSENKNISETENTNSETSDDSSDAPWKEYVGKNEIYFSYMRLIFSTLFVVMFIFGVFFFLRKKGVISGSHIRLIEIYAVDSAHKIMIAEIAGKYLILGVSQRGINTLAEITDPDTIASIRLKESHAQKNVNFFEQMKKSGVITPAADKNKEFIESAVEKIKKIGGNAV